MSGLQISGRVVYGQPFGPFAIGVAGATVKIFDLDEGGNGNDLILTTTTDQNGEFDGMSSDWVDANIHVNRVPVPPTWDPGTWVDAHWAKNQLGVPIWYGGHYEGGHWVTHPDAQIPTPVPDILVMQISIQYDGQTEAYGYLQGPGRATVTVSGSAPVVAIPSEDPAAASRPARIALRAARYRWQKDATDPLPRVSGSPPDELPPPSYVQARTPIETGILQTFATNAARLYVDPIDSIAEFDLLLPPAPPVNRPSALDDDAEFARQRVQGINPLVVEAWPKSTPQGCNFTDKHLAPFGLTIESAAKANRLFLCDYAILEGATTAAGRYFHSPYALFLAMPTGPGGIHELQPVAIQVERGVADASRMSPVTPKDKRWRFAKAAVQMADLNYHELKSHLFECHLAMETFAVAAARKLASNHPLSVLLTAHFNLLIHQNIAARAVLVNDGGLVDVLLGTGIAGAREIAKRARETWTFAGAGLRSSLARRGIAATPDAQFSYPYRDDALLLWDAIEAHVKRWVNRFYANDDRVGTDLELQAWRNESMDPAAGDLGALPALNDRAALASMLTQIVFTCTAQHSAVNYPQFRYFGLVPNMPASLRGDWFTAADPFLVLPRGSDANGQVRLSAELSLFQYDRLGQYTQINDSRLQLLASQFRSALLATQQTIDQRNAPTHRRVPYTALHPMMVANSISI